MCFAVHPVNISALNIDDPAILPPVSGTGELLSNADFESYFNSSWNQYVGCTYSRECVYAGRRSMKMCVTEGDHTYISQGKAGLVKGAVYQISARVYVAEDNLRFCIANEYYGTNSSWNGQEMWLQELTAGSWTQIAATFEIPEDTQSTFVYFWLYGSGNEAYIDDTSLVMVREPVRVNMTTDQVYYYTNEDVTQGSVKLSVNTNSYSDYESWNCELNICDSSGNKLYSQNNIAVAEEEVYVDFPLSYLENPSEEYLVSVVVRSSDGTVLEQHSEKIYRKFARPSYIGSDGCFYVNGEEFVPVIGYWVFDQSDFYAQAKSMGVNVIETAWGNMDKPDEVIAELDRLHANGFMGIVSLYYEYTTGWNEIYRENTKNLINRVKDHPAVFAYCLMDEPIGKKIDLDELGEAYEYIRSVDSVHPVYACDMNPNFAEKLSKYHDVVCFDCYPGSPLSALNYVSNPYSEAEFYIRNQKKPMLSILLFYECNGYFPSANEMRNMLYQNYINGGKGHGFYSIGWTNVTDSETGNTVRNLDTPTAEAVKQWSANEQEIFADCFVYDKFTDIASGADNSVEWEIYEYDDHVYLIARNLTLSNQNVNINSGVFTDGMTVLDEYVSGNGNQIAIYDGYAELTIPAADACVYRLVPENEEILLCEEDFSTYGYRIYKKRGIVYVDITNKVTYTSKVITIDNDIFKSDSLLKLISGSNSEVISLTDGQVQIRVPKNSSTIYKVTWDDDTLSVPFEENTDIYSFKLYKMDGDIYIDVTNKVTYASKVITIDNDLIKSYMLLELVNGDNSEIISLTDEQIKIRVPKNTTVTYRITQDDGALPVPFDGNTVVTSLSGGKTIHCSGAVRTNTIIVLYKGNAVENVVYGKLGEDVSMTLPQTIDETHCIKLMRWNELVPVTESIRIPK